MVILIRWVRLMESKRKNKSNVILREELDGKEGKPCR